MKLLNCLNKIYKTFHFNSKNSKTKFILFYKIKSSKSVWIYKNRTNKDLKSRPKLIQNWKLSLNKIKSSKINSLNKHNQILTKKCNNCNQNSYKKNISMNLSKKPSVT